MIQNSDYKQDKNQKVSQLSFMLQERLTKTQEKDLRGIRDLVDKFVKKYEHKTVTLLTSGGTSVPMQKNAVRFLQNFSTGLRGSKLAEAILQHDHPLIYFYREKSFLPYQNGISLNQAILSQTEEQMNQLVKARQNHLKRKNQILLIPFTSIYMYLNGILQIKKSLPRKSIVVLCAAVSDFIPKSVPTHKITTSEQIILELQNSPKILAQMTSQNLLCVSFKLETDPSVISQRIEFALNKYQVDMVVGNILGNKNWVHIQYNKKRFPSKQFVQHTQDIENNIWKEILQSHSILFR